LRPVVYGIVTVVSLEHFSFSVDNNFTVIARLDRAIQ
jgi:hypothetical protein